MNNITDSHSLQMLKVSKEVWLDELQRVVTKVTVKTYSHYCCHNNTLTCSLTYSGGQIFLEEVKANDYDAEICLKQPIKT